MDKKIEAELTELLKQVSDTYDDFVECTLVFFKSDDERQKIIDFIKNNPEADTSTIINYCWDNIKKCVLSET